MDVITSERLVNEEENGLSLRKKFSLNVGPLTLSNQPQPKPKKGGALNEAGKVLSKGLQTAFFGADSDSLAIYVGGDLDSLVSLEVYDSGQKLNPGWSVTSDNEKKMTFSKPTGSAIDIKLKYWDGLERITIPIKL